MSKPDDRRDNARKIKQNIEATKRNIELAEDMMGNTSDPKTKSDLAEKNKRRANAIKPMVREMKEEAANNNN